MIRMLSSLWLHPVHRRDYYYYFTSISRHYLAPLAEKMAKLAAEVGATGVVAPATRPERIRLIRSIIGDRTIISPGIGAQGGSPAAAINAGADYLIVGRSIYEAEDPEGSAKTLLATIRRA